MTRAGSRAVTTNRSSGSAAPPPGRSEPALVAGQVERTARLVDEHGPARGTDQPRDRHAPAVGPQAIASLAVPHAINRAAAVELRPSLAQAEHRAVAQGKVKASRPRVDVELLNAATVGGVDANRQRLARHGHASCRAVDRPRLRRAT